MCTLFGWLDSKHTKKYCWAPQGSNWFYATMRSTARNTCPVYYWASGPLLHVQDCPTVSTRTLIWTNSMKNKIAVALLAALTLLFAFLALWSALAFIIADNWIAKILGIAV